jgi:hypothetical protein
VKYLRLAFIAVLSAAPLLKTQPPNIGIFMQFDAAPGALQVDAMETEVGKLFQPSGLALMWRLASENRGGEVFSGLAMVRFKGTWSAEHWQNPAGRSLPDEIRSLGSTEVADGRVLPFSEVHCDEVRKALAFLRPGTGLKEKQQALGRALGRVLARELYHILANAEDHTTQGLARAVEPLPALISPKSVGFLDADWKAVDEGLTAR